ncbi:MAG TPA: VWA domain-containing protein [Chromatiales bacterium]|nr:VWA domain-containing protein [Chromatiales bacterium]
MFEFHWPWAGILLVLPLLLRWLWPRPESRDEAPVQGQRTVLLHPAVEELQRIFQGDRPGTPLAARLHKLLLGLLWVSLVAALMRPQWLEPHEEVRSTGYDLMLAVDTSHSMEALDFTVSGRQVTRMAVVKGVMGRFIEGRKDDRIGLVIFGSQAFVLSPLTLDREAVRRLLDGVVPGIAGQGTAMGDGIGLGVKKLRERPEGSRVLVLIADGENTAGRLPPLQAARLAAQEGVRIYAIGVGSDRKQVPIYEGNPRRLVYRDDLGFDEENMRRIAEITGGAYFRATDTRALEEIYQRIDELEKSESESRTGFIPSPLYRWPLGVGLICLLLLGLFPEGRRRTFVGGGHA